MLRHVFPIMLWGAAIAAVPAGAIVAPRHASPILGKTDYTGVNTALRVPSATPRRADAALSALQRFTVRPFHAAWDEQRGVATSLSGRSKPFGSEPVSAARAFLREAQPVLGPAANPDALAEKAAGGNAFGHQVAFEQTLNGVPVLGQGVTVNLTADGEILTVENTTRPVPDIDTTPAVSMLRAASALPGKAVGQPQLFVDAQAGEPRLVWQATVAQAPDRVYRYTVDARTGELLDWRNTVEHVTGSGKVYIGNPVSTPTLTTQPFLSLDGSGQLAGAWALIKHYTGTDINGYPQGTPDINEPSFVYNYPVGDHRLAEAEAYYGLTTIHDYFKSTFNFTGRDEQMPAWVGWTGLANAFFSPQLGTDGGMAFGIDGTYDFALDADVLYHEYTHAVTDKWSPLYANAIDGRERGGISEGQADYFSSTKLNDPALGEYVAKDFGLTSIRDLRGRKHYPEAVQLENLYTGTVPATPYQDLFPEEHQEGELWGPACWDLRIMLGQTKADQLIFKATSLFGASTMFQSALVNILAADQTLYGGADAAVIRQVFNGRGIYETTNPISYLTSSSFYSSTTNASKIQTGYWGTDSANKFYPSDPNYFSPLGIFPSLVVGRYYAMWGYSSDSAVKSVFLVITDSAGTVKTYSGFNTTPINAIVNNVATTYQGMNSLFRIPTAAIPTGQTSLTGVKLSLWSYTVAAATVAANFAGTTPKSKSASYNAQLLVDGVTTPVFAPPSFGDTDGNGKATIADAILVVRSISGLQILTTDQETRADIAAPQNGTPNAADAAAILRKAAGLS